ncbi:trypsin 3A1-like [Cloeon dipterum]|uniref:trypsin 3A1-like n=1 Tax=Cloeon dipterum TaxID=197152 RepID=UPI00321F8AD1
MLCKVVLLLACCATVLSGGLPNKLPISKLGLSKAGAGRLIGGTPVAKGEVPWHISLQYFDQMKSEWVYFCDGSIISRDFILTDAFCSLESLDTMRVIAGTSDLTNPRNITEAYNDDRTSNHLTLYRVDPPFEFDCSIQAVQLPARFSASVPGTVTTVSGVGESAPYQPSGRLEKLLVPIVSKDLCSILLPGADLIYLICAGDSDETTGFCTSIGYGSPLAYNSELRGILYSKPGCNLPELYTEVSLFREWIFRITGV